MTHTVPELNFGYTTSEGTWMIIEIKNNIMYIKKMLIQESERVKLDASSKLCIQKDSVHINH